jgi:hypothetical protein
MCAMSFDRRKRDSDAGADGGSEIAPGKTARTDRLPVQRKGAGDATDDVAATAEAGVQGAGERLPFLDVIQSSFGRHDVRGIESHSDTAARGAAADIGASAYATGNDVAFARSPDLHTAAHEAAHVVQQRAGVQLKGGVGAAGDAYEQHADEVADLVVQGQSAETALDRHAPSGGPSTATRGVQRSPDDEANAPGRKGVKPADRRQVITFLMGSGDAFYNEATGYWSQSGKTDILVKNTRTFSDIMAYLAANPASNGKPWAEINIVVHAHEDGGMSMKLDADSKTNVTQAELQAKVDAKQVKAIDDAIVDHETNVNVHGCALGRNTAMLQTISQAMGGADKEAPTVYGTKDLQGYAHAGSNYEEFLAEYWTVGFPSKKPITGKALIAEFKTQHAGVQGVDWDKEVPKAVERHSSYDGVVDITHTVIPAKTDKAGHQALLKLFGKDKEWDSWSVLEQTTKVTGTKEKTSFKYEYKKGDENGTQTFEIESDTLPRTEAEQDAYVKAEIGAAEFDKYSWTYAVNDPKGTPGTNVTATFKYTGARTFMRVQKDLLDAKNARIDPSRTDATHYANYAPPQPVTP